MAWYAAKTTGRDSRAAWYLEHRAMLTVFCPAVHDYDPLKRHPRGQKYTARALFPGYVFIEAETIQERLRAANAIGVAYMLGNWVGSEYVPKELPKKWITTLIDAGPLEINKPKPKAEWRKGTKVKLALNNIAQIIAEVEGIDNAGKVVVRADLLGGVRMIHVDDSRLVAAE